LLISPAFIRITADMTDISPQKRAYWEYQYRLGKEYLVPLLRQWGISFQAARVLDIGCGEGGVLCVMAGASGLGDCADV